jgi:DnaJ-class molecular chaperone
MKKNYYEILEVSTNASPEIIEKAYKTLTRKYHPDVQSKDNSQSTENHFKDIVKAYEVLSDPERRTEYDEYQLLKTEVDALKSEKKTDTDSKQESDKKAAVNYFKNVFKTTSQVVYNHSKKSKEDRSKDLKAFGIAIAFMFVVILIIWKVPFINNFLFP